MLSIDTFHHLESTVSKYTLSITSKLTFAEFVAEARFQSFQLILKTAVQQYQFNTTQFSPVYLNAANKEYFADLMKRRQGKFRS